VYLLGDSGSEYFYTHLGTRSAIVGQRVSAGQQIGTVGNYAKWGGANHTHVGVHPQENPRDVGNHRTLGHPDIYDLMAAPLAVKG